nr:uracil-DNA glycosylase [uncultured Cohaesibacter sp.]
MLNTVTSAHDLAALIEWYGAMGADCALDDLPQDRFEESQRQARERAALRASRTASSDNRDKTEHSQPVGSTLTLKSPSNQSRPSLNAPQHGLSDAEATKQAPAFLNPGSATLVEDARQMAARAQTLAELRQALAKFEGCSLKLSAKSLVFGDGNPEADVMFIGEAPGRDEDLQGVPFVGRAGQLLDKMMAAIKLDRSNSYITNILPWRPPGNRKPSIDEQAMLQPFIHRHIELVNPKLLVFLGGTAAQQLLDSKDGIMRLRGRWRTYSAAGRDIPVMSTLHPAFLLRTPAQKRAAWQDLLEVAAKLDSLR